MLYVCLVTYFLLQSLVLYRSWRPQSVEEYSAAPNSVSLPFLVLSLVGTTVGGGMFLGVSRLGFENPVGAITIGAVYLIGNCLIGVLAPSFRKFACETGSLTIDELAVSFSGSSGKSLMTLFRVVSTFVYVLMLAAQFLALLDFVHFVSGTPTSESWIVATILVVCTIASYALVGGLRRDILSDCVQMLFVAAGTACLAILMSRSVPQLSQSVPGELLDVTFSNSFFIVFALISILPTFFVRFDIWQRVIAARSDSHARWAFIFAGVLSMAFFVIFGFVGVYARADGLPSTNDVGLQYIGRFSSNWLYPVVLLAFFGAVVSTADTFLNVSGITAMRLLERFAGRSTALIDPNPRRSLTIKLCTIACGLVAALLAFQMKSIVTVFSSSFALLSAFVIPFFAALRGGESALRGATPAVVSALLLFAIALRFSPNAAFLVPLFAVALFMPLFARLAHRR